MKIGKPIGRSSDGGVLPPNMPKPRKTKLGLALLAAVPAAVVLGAVLKRKTAAARGAQQPVSPEDRQPPLAERKETTLPGS